MTGSDPGADADARDDDSSASTASETTATTEPMSDSTPDADERDSSTTDAAPDPDALFEDEADPGGRTSPGSDPGARGPAESDLGAAAAGTVSIDDGPIAKLYWAGLAAAIAFGAFALYRFYASVTAAIDVWVAADYQPLLQAAFNFAVLLSAALAASLLVRRLRAGGA